MKVVEEREVTGPFLVKEAKIEEKHMFLIVDAAGFPLIGLWEAKEMAEALCFGLNHGHAKMWTPGATHSVN